MDWLVAVSLGASAGHAPARNGINPMDPRVPYLIRLRVLAVLRSLRAELGISPAGTVLALAMLLAGAGVGGLLALRAAAADPRSAAALAALGPTVASGIHAWRRDPGLLRRAHVPTRTLFAIEYGVLALPLAVALGLVGRPMLGLASVAAAGLVAAFPTHVRHRRSGRRQANLPIEARWWSQAAFEWTRTTRRGRTGAAVAVAGGTLGGIVRPDLPFVPLIAVAIITLATLGGYVGTSAAEGWDLVSAYARAPARFLARKVGLVVAGVGPVLLVPTVAFAAAAPNAERLAVAVGVAAFALAIVATGVVIKYAYYRPGEPPPPVAVIVWLAALLCALAQAPLLAPLIGAYLARRAVATVAPYLSVATGPTPVPRRSRPPHADSIDQPHAAAAPTRSPASAADVPRHTPDAASALSPSPASVTPVGSAGGLRVTGLTVGYGSGRPPVLRDVSFAVPPGEVHGVVGRNGAGKTTLLNAVAGLLSADAGTCTVGGTRADLATVAYLPVETHLYSHITGREYLRIFDEAPRRGLRELVSHWRHGGRSRAESAAWEDAWAEAFELPLDALVNTYSTGMRRKLALVGAFRLDRPLVVLDEPTNGLDLEANQVLARIVRAVADRGASVVITSHILEALEAACHAVHVIEGGRLAGSFRRHEFPTLRRHLEGDVDRRVSALEGLIGRAAE